MENGLEDASAGRDSTAINCKNITWEYYKARFFRSCHFAVRKFTGAEAIVNSADFSLRFGIKYRTGKLIISILPLVWCAAAAKPREARNMRPLLHYLINRRLH